MSAYLLRDAEVSSGGRLYRLSERFIHGMLRIYEHGLRWVLRHRRITLAVTLGTIGLTAYLYVIIPKGFFSQQDTGFIVGVSEAAQDISFSAMLERQNRLVDILLKDEAVDGVISAVGAGGINSTVNNGRVFINLKPRSERDASASQIIDRLRPKVSQVESIALFVQAAQDINVGARFSRAQCQFTLQDAHLDELDHRAPKLYGALQGIPLLRDVATDQHDPVGGSGRAPRPHAVPLRTQRRRTHRNHPLDRDREEECDNDDRLCAPCRANGEMVFRGVDLSSRHLALPSYHDDDQGRSVGSHPIGFGALERAPNSPAA